MTKPKCCFCGAEVETSCVAESDHSCETRKRLVFLCDGIKLAAAEIARIVAPTEAEVLDVSEELRDIGSTEVAREDYWVPALMCLDIRDQEEVDEEAGDGETA